MKTIAFGTLAVASTALAFFAASPAMAHAALVHANPAADATVASPDQIALQFSEGLAAKFSSLELSKDGKKVALAKLAIDPKGMKDMTVAPQAPLTPGLYKVTWTAVASDDLHKTQGSFSFTVK